MKKLMIAAAAAAMIGGAYAELCDEEVATTSCALYDVKFKFKTLAAKDARCTAAQLNAMVATLPALDTDADGDADRGIAYLDNATRTFDGVLWQCVTACFEGVTPNDNNAANNGRINFALWEKKTEMAISPLVHYWPKGVPAAADTQVLWASLADESLQFAILGRYGSKATKVAAYWTPSINADFETLAGANDHTANFVAAGVTINAAGFGSWDKKTELIKSLSGNAVAKLVPTSINTRGDICADGTQLIAVLAYMCGDEFRSWCCVDCVAAALAPASGTWSLKYNSKKSRNGRLSQIIPDYMVFTEAAGGNARP